MNAWPYIVFAIALAFGPAYADSAGVTIARGNVSADSSVRSWDEMRSENMVRQQFDFSCGAASMATVLKYFFGDDVEPRDVVHSLLKISGHEVERLENLEEDFAFSFQDLGEYAESKGFKAIGLALSLDTLEKLRVPAILYLQTSTYKHFVVFEGIKDGYVHLADPSFGNERVRVSRFKERLYTRSDATHPGKALILVPKTEARKARIQKGFMKIPESSGYAYRTFSDKAAENAIKDKVIGNAISIHPMIR